VPWAGIGACLLAWCAAGRPLRVRDWAARLACAFGGACLARILFEQFPEVFLPLYKNLATQYADFRAHPNLHRLANDSRHAITHLGFYLGCLGYEIARRDKRNIALILSVGLLNGLGWALLQNWSWAKRLWPDSHFNFWRCWESSGGISIGLAYGVAYYLVNRPMPEPERAAKAAWLGNEHPNLERFGAYLGLVLGLGLSVKNGLKGWANIYLGNEHYWDRMLWMIIGPLLIAGLAALVWRIRTYPRPRGYDADVFPHAGWLMAIVLIVQNTLAQLVTGPWTAWNEVAFSIYYLILFALTAVILYHFHGCKKPGGFKPGNALPNSDKAGKLLP